MPLKHRLQIVNYQQLFGFIFTTLTKLFLAPETTIVVTLFMMIYQIFFNTSKTNKQEVYGHGIKSNVFKFLLQLKQYEILYRRLHDILRAAVHSNSFSAWRKFSFKFHTSTFQKYKRAKYMITHITLTHSTLPSSEHGQFCPITLNL